MNETRFRSLLILGGGGHGRVVADAAIAAGWEKVAFLDDRFPDVRRSGDFEIIGSTDVSSRLADEWRNAIAAVGASRRRMELMRVAQASGFKLPNVIHPSAVLSPRAVLGIGIFLGPGTVVNTGATLADGVIVNTRASIDHDCQIGEGCHLAPGVTLSGNVTIGARSWIGTGASVIQGVRIGEDATVGAGAAVISDLEAGGTYVGVPARPLAPSRTGKSQC